MLLKSNSKEIPRVLNLSELPPFAEEDGTTRVKFQLKHSKLDYNAKDQIFRTEASSRTASVEESSSWQPTQRQRACEENYSTRVLYHWSYKMP